MEFLIGTSCFIGGAFVGAVLMAIVAGSKREDNYDDTDHLRDVWRNN